MKVFRGKLQKKKTLGHLPIHVILLMILKLHALLLLDLLTKVEKVGCSGCLKLSSQ